MTRALKILAICAWLLNWTYLVKPNYSDILGGGVCGSGSSGYYGPGACAAWLLLMISNTEFQMLILLPLRVVRKWPLVQETDMGEQDVDATILGSVAYPVVSCIAGFVSNGFHLTMREVNTCNPPLGIAYLAWTTSVIALSSHCLVALHGRDVYGSRASSASPKLRKYLHRRSLLWVLTCAFSSVLISRHEAALVEVYHIPLKELRDTDRLQGTLKSKPLFIAEILAFAITPMIFLGAIVFTYQHYCHGRSPKISGYKSSFFLIIFIARTSLWRTMATHLTWDFAYPDTGINLGELDQVAALAVAILIVAVSLFRGGRQLIKFSESFAERTGLMALVAREDFNAYSDEEAAGDTMIAQDRVWGSTTMTDHTESIDESVQMRMEQLDGSIEAAPIDLVEDENIGTSMEQDISEAQRNDLI